MNFFFKIKLLLLVFFIYLMPPQSYGMPIELDVDMPVSANIIYEPFSGTVGIETIELDIALKELDIDKEVILRISRVDLTDFSSIGLNGSMTLELGAHEKGAPFVKDGIAYEGVFNATLEERTYPIVFVIPETQYSDKLEQEIEFNFEFFDKETGLELLSRIFRLTLVVPEVLQINLAGTSSSSFTDGFDTTTVNFGKLETGESKRIYVQARGNVPAKILISSLNKGKMLAANHDGVVNYSIDFDGIKSQLNSPLNVDRLLDKNINGSSYPLSFIVGETKGLFTDTYKDIVNIDINAQ